MNLKIKNPDVEELGKLTGDPRLEKEYRYGSSNKITDVEIDGLLPSTVTAMIAFFEKRSTSGTDADAYLVRKLKAYVELSTSPGGTAIKDVSSIVTAMTHYIGPSPNKWVFTENSDGYLVPYFVKSIIYTPPREEYPAHTTIEMVAYNRTEQVTRSLTFYRRDLSGGKTTAFDLLAEHGFYLEKPETVETFNQEIEAWKPLREKLGSQMIATGLAKIEERWSANLISMERNGIPTKVVVDDHEGDGEDDSRSRGGRTRSAIVSAAFWDKFTKREAKKSGEDFDEDAAKETVVLPAHPYLRVFDLDKHAFCVIHVSNLQDYPWDETLADKLVLPADTKDLIEILIKGTSLQLTDIVRGKMPGVIVLAVGDPGTGKTLTAEVMSEQIRLPLYTVQCSQLGTDEEAVEKNLKSILARATRWNAILLIDEADVYIRERGTDIGQNAIVGIFLRVLEYYRGVLFLTSNMATQLDDAIVSRATAYIRYERPNKDELAQIWTILSTHFGAEFNEEQIETLVDTFPTITGRNVRSLLKLGSLLAKKRHQVLTVPLIVHIARFQNMASGTSTLPPAQQAVVKAKVTPRSQSDITGEMLKEKLTEILADMNEEESITTSTLFSALGKKINLDDENVWNLKSRIGMEIKSLADEGKIKLHTKGRGSIPDIYRKAVSS